MEFLFSSDFFNFTFLNLSLKKWIMVDVILILAFLISYVFARILNKMAFGYLKYIQFSRLSNSHERMFVLPINIILIGWIFIIALSILNLNLSELGFIIQLAKVVTYFGLVMLGWRFIDLFNLHLTEKTEKTASKFDDLLVPLITRVLKVIVLIIGILSIAEILKLPLASLVAGLGIGGLAIAMAAKDTIANVFGSVTVVSDRPFNIGDWVKIGDTEGTVERLGFRSTRIRTFYDSVVTVPNSNLLTAVVDNLGERKYRRYSTKLGIVYSTPPDKINEFCEVIRQLILNHENTRKDGFYVYLNDFSESSIDILLYCFFEVPTWEAELKARNDLLNAILKIAAELGIEFAFPTQTVYYTQKK